MDIDLTYLFQLGLFLICLVTINGLLLRPFLRVIMERDEKIEGAQEDSERLQKLGDADMEKYQARMRDAKVKAQAEREKHRNEGREAERKLLAEVRAEIAHKIDEARTEIGAAEIEAQKDLSVDTEKMARQLVEKVLGRKVAA